MEFKTSEKKKKDVGVEKNSKKRKAGDGGAGDGEVIKSLKTTQLKKKWKAANNEDCEEVELRDRRTRHKTSNVIEDEYI